jgi:hypothetical protein
VCEGKDVGLLPVGEGGENLLEDPGAVVGMGGNDGGEGSDSTVLAPPPPQGRGEGEGADTTGDGGGSNGLGGLTVDKESSDGVP